MTLGVFPTKPNAVAELFGTDKVVIGVVHLPPLPGSPHYRGTPLDEISRYAVEEASSYLGGGCHAVIVENHWDIPFLKPGEHGYETAAAMAVVTQRVRDRAAAPLGVSVLSNAAEWSIAAAWAGGAGFVRVNQWANAYVANEGLIEGPAAEAMRYRRAVAAEGVRIFADSHVKHGAHAITADRSLAELTRDLEWSGADAVIATGQRTGDPAAGAELLAIKAATVLPVLVGSGATAANVAGILAIADGVIVASSLKTGGMWWNAVEPTAAKAFMTAAAPSR